MNKTKLIACPRCRQKIAIPAVREVIHVTCPKCRSSWDWPTKSKIITWFEKFKPDNVKDFYRRILIPEPLKRLALYAFAAVVALFLLRELHKHISLRALFGRDSASTASVVDGATARNLANITPHASPAMTIPETTNLPSPLPGKAASPDKAPRPVWDGAPEEALPKTGDGAYFFEETAATGRLKFVPRTEQKNVVVKLTKTSDSQLACWVFIRQGDYAEIQLPPGTYRCKIACGAHWYGEKNLFGPYASYASISSVISIPYNETYTIDCHPGLNGALREAPLDSKDF